MVISGMYSFVIILRKRQSLAADDNLYLRVSPSSISSQTDHLLLHGYRNIGGAKLRALAQGYRKLPNAIHVP